MRMEIVSPCAQCPFRRDVPGFLGESRAREIAQSLLDDKTFPCHKTVDYGREDREAERQGDDGEDRDTTWRPDPREQHCAGALIFLLKQQRPNQWMQICERLGWWDASAVRMESPVFDSAQEMAEHHGRLSRLGSASIEVTR